MEQKLDEIQSKAASQIAAARSIEELENIRVKVLGRKGDLTGILEPWANYRQRSVRASDRNPMRSRTTLNPHRKEKASFSNRKSTPFRRNGSSDAAARRQPKAVCTRPFASAVADTVRNRGYFYIDGIRGAGRPRSGNRLL